MSLARQLPFDPTYIFYDGDCGTCERMVRFLLQRTRKERFRFVSLAELRKSRLEESIRRNLGLDLESSLIVWKNGQLYARFAAVLVILSELAWPWRPLLMLRLFPLALLNWLYDLYARHRYDLLGRATHPDLCQILPESQRTLFAPAFPDDHPVFSSRKDVFLSAQWRDLVFVNFSVPPEVLQPFVPAGTELDTWQGQTLVSLVAFAFVQTSLAGMTLPMHADFEEINLRFYVKRKIRVGDRTEWRRAVVFLKEIVPHYTLAWTARLFYGERYAYEKTSSERKEEGDCRERSYSWGEGSQRCELTARMRGLGQRWDADSLPGFITEHYYGYVQGQGGVTVEYEVEHPRWVLWSPVEISLEGPWKTRYPKQLAEHLTTIHSALVAEGSVVRVMKGVKLDQLPRA
jgi:predicted DCC family thiol-disulfide oxidoreductase YuxK/uncharacterized protein YqjF (DUF2071 family)